MTAHEHNLTPLRAHSGYSLLRGTVPPHRLARRAAELGYTTTIGQMEKLAEASYTTGYNGAVEAIYKLANDSFVRGFEDTAQLVTELRK